MYSPGIGGSVSLLILKPTDVENVFFWSISTE